MVDAQSRRIGIFGGTFDPVHNGHLSIAKSFLESDYIETLWVLLNPSPPHKPDDKFAPYAARLKMLKEAFGPIEGAVVSNLENKLPKPTYTVQTVSHLTTSYPKDTFYLCMGEDSFLSFKSWRKWQEILEHCTLLVADRPIKNTGEVDTGLLNHVEFVDHDPVQVSSTEIRNRIAQGKPVDRLIPSPILAIIREEGLYHNV
jgi:nicotinate-nucleotide adenylyltransferase